jgi:hypothetical protein
MGGALSKVFRHRDMERLMGWGGVEIGDRR